jgi:hypothetical protein
VTVERTREDASASARHQPVRDQRDPGADESGRQGVELEVGEDPDALVGREFAAFHPDRLRKASTPAAKSTRSIQIASFDA